MTLGDLDGWPVDAVFALDRTNDDIGFNRLERALNNLHPGVALGSGFAGVDMGSQSAYHSEQAIRSLGFATCLVWHHNVFVQCG